MCKDNKKTYSLPYDANDTKVTQFAIKTLIDEAEYTWMTVYEKCTLMIAKLKNGFIITESSACVDKSNYDFELGKKICLNKLEDKLWELEGYMLQTNGIGTITYSSSPMETLKGFIKIIPTSNEHNDKED